MPAVMRLEYRPRSAAQTECAGGNTNCLRVSCAELAEELRRVQAESARQQGTIGALETESCERFVPRPGLFLF